MRAYLVKIVRDRIGDLLPADAQHIYYEPIGDPEIIKRELRKKLVEEAIEYLQDPSLTELADVYEVMAELARIDLGLDMGHVDSAALEKLHAKGAFREGIGMYVNTLAP